MGAAGSSTCIATRYPNPSRCPHPPPFTASDVASPPSPRARLARLQPACGVAWRVSVRERAAARPCVSLLSPPLQPARTPKQSRHLVHPCASPRCPPASPSPPSRRWQSLPSPPAPRRLPSSRWRQPLPASLPPALAPWRPGTATPPRPRPPFSNYSMPGTPPSLPPWHRDAPHHSRSSAIRRLVDNCMFIRMPRRAFGKTNRLGITWRERAS